MQKQNESFLEAMIVITGVAAFAIYVFIAVMGL